MSTHCRTIPLKRQTIVVAPIPPAPPGEVVSLRVVTAGDGTVTATATWYSPLGAAPGTMDYVTQLTGGPGTVQIVSVVPLP